jgi:hypothetical protein
VRHRCRFFGPCSLAQRAAIVVAGPRCCVLLTGFCAATGFSFSLQLLCRARTGLGWRARAAGFFVWFSSSRPVSGLVFWEPRQGTAVGVTPPSVFRAASPGFISVFVSHRRLTQRAGKPSRLGSCLIWSRKSCRLSRISFFPSRGVKSSALVPLAFLAECRGSAQSPVALGFSSLAETPELALRSAPFGEPCRWFSVDFPR